MSDVKMVVNGRTITGNVEDRTLLVHFLRENLGMTGTHVGCDTSQCGACVVHLDGKAVKSCSILAVQASGSEVVTIEGLTIACCEGTAVRLHPRHDHGSHRHDQSPPGRSRRKDRASRTRRQHLPLHRLSQHRQGDPGGVGNHVESRGQGRLTGEARAREEKAPGTVASPAIGSARPVPNRRSAPAASP